MTIAETGSHNAAAHVLALVAYAKLAACEGHAADAAVSPLETRMVFDMASAKEEHCFMLAYGRLKDLTGDPITAMARFSAPIDILAHAEPSSQWWERILGTYVGHGIVTDVCRELAVRTNRADLFDGLLKGCAAADDLARLLSEVIAADERSQARLSLWGRRVVGDYITVIQRMVAQTPEFMELISINDLADAEGNPVAESCAADEIAVSRLQGVLTGNHTHRMEGIGLTA